MLWYWSFVRTTFEFHFYKTFPYGSMVRWIHAPLKLEGVVPSEDLQNGI